MAEELMEVYKTIFETWRSQVDSSWQRSTYFATFEIAAIGGCWYLASNPQKLQVGAGIAFSVGGFILTIIWLLSTKKTWEYVRHWWDSIRELEKDPVLARHNFAQQLEQKTSQDNACTVRYKCLVLSIPILFAVAWVAIFLVAVVRFVCLVRT